MDPLTIMKLAGLAVDLTPVAIGLIKTIQGQTGMNLEAILEHADAKFDDNEKRLLLKIAKAEGVR